MQRQATENRRGQRHDRSAQQVEYHGLRDYRSGDSPRWIHWRTSARRGELMVKEFEQQNEQDLAILIDPWLPRTKAAAEQREALEEAISFAATLCLLETCRRPGPPARSGLDGSSRFGRPARPGFGQALARTARATGRDEASERGGPGGIVRRDAARCAPRGADGDRFMPAGQLDRRSGTIVAAFGRLGSQLARPCPCLEQHPGRPGSLVPACRQLDPRHPATSAQ